MGIGVSKDCTPSIFKVEGGGSTFLSNIGVSLQKLHSITPRRHRPAWSQLITPNLTLIFVLFQLMDYTWLKELNLKIPIPRLPRLMGVFRFEKPTSVSVIGSFGAGCCLGPDIRIDMKVEMPQVMAVS
jgi:hypothetical protein